MDSLKFAVLVIIHIHQVSLAGGAVTIAFDDNGYIGQSIVLQCKTDAASIISPSAIWYFNGSALLSTSAGKYTEIKTSDGFNLTVSDLTVTDAGFYRCRIDLGSSPNKTLGILYNTSIQIVDNQSNLMVTITILAYPAPQYDVILRENGNLVTVLWKSANITQADGAIKITQWSTLDKKDYNLTVNVTSPVAAFQNYIVKFAPSSQPGNDSALKLRLGLGIGIPIVVCIIVIIVIVILFKKVNIKAKDELQKPIPEDSEMTIAASIHGFYTPSIQWNGPDGSILTSNKKFNITYDKDTGISTLQISALAINDSGLYTCRAIGACGSSAQDSVRISVYENLAVDIDIGETGQHGRDVNIICSVYGSENKSVDWTGQEENILTNGGRYTIAPYDSNTNKSCLTISTSSMTNAEGYICQVEFKKPGVSVKIYITVSDNGSLRVSIEKILLFVPASENESRKWIGPQENILTDTGKYSIVPYDRKTNKSHLTIKDFSMNDNGSFTCQPKNSSGSSPKYSIKVTTNGNRKIKSGPPGTKNKVDPKTTSEQTNLLPVDTGVKDTQKIRPQPPLPQNSDIKDRNQRGISATIDDTPGLANETPRPSKLPPLPLKQATVQEEDASGESKMKRKKKKKKDQMNDGNPEVEII